MKKNDFIQLKTKTLPELLEKVREKRAEADNLVLDKGMNKLKDLKLIKKRKKDLAQILTVLRQKQLFESLESKAEKKGEKIK